MPLSRSAVTVKSAVQSMNSGHQELAVGTPKNR
jgi:hypothetical protein